MSTDYETRVVGVLVCPVGQPTYSEMCTRIEITDEAAGEFVEVSQGRADAGRIRIEPGEWPALRAAIDDMINLCRGRPDDAP